MKIIFLDFDGVIRLGKYRDDGSFYSEFSKDACDLINKLCDLTGAKIVVSSDIRHDIKDIHMLAKLVPIEACHYHHAWRTPKIGQNFRCEEIKEWFWNEEPVESFIVIDDNEKIIEPLLGRAVICNNRFGFNDWSYEQAKLLLC